MNLVGRRARLPHAPSFLEWHRGGIATEPRMFSGFHRFCAIERRANPGDIMKRFQGTETYVATEDLRVAVNAAIALERPLLVKGEPGTGKTILAHEIARALGKTLITWHIK